MPTSDAYNKTDRLHQIQLLFWNNPGKRLRTSEIAVKLEVSEDTALRYLTELSSTGRLPVNKDGWYWQLAQGAKFELLPMKLNLSEGTALYLAARLLTQIHDEHNEHVLSALSKLISGMPATIAPYQRAIVDLARERQKGQQDKSVIFESLALGWATRRKVRLVYTPPHRRTFECQFSPYLPRAWGVMYGDEEPVEVRLRFSHWVTKRVKDTLWHPSQQITDTAEGWEWLAQIGDTLEIENWIRGWGSDCEVLAPQELREKMIKEARRLAHMYGVTPVKSTPPDEPDIDLLSGIFGG